MFFHKEQVFLNKQIDLQPLIRYQNLNSIQLLRKIFSKLESILHHNILNYMGRINKIENGILFPTSNYYGFQPNFKEKTNNYINTE